MKKTILIIIILCLFVGCSSEQQPAIKTENALIISLNILDSTITFYNEQEDKVITWKLDHPFKDAVLLNYDEILFMHPKNNQAFIYQLSTGQQIASWEIGKGMEKVIVYNDTVYFSNQANNSVDLYSLNGQKQTEVQVEGKPFLLLPHENKLFVSLYNKNKMTVIDLSHLNVTNTFSTDEKVVDGFMNENKLWLGGHGQGEHIQENVILYDITSGEEFFHIPAGTMPIGFASHGQYVYVISHGSNQLFKINMKTYKIESTKTIGPNPFSIVYYHDSLYVDLYDNNKLLKIDPTDLTILKEIDVGEGPFQLLIRNEGT
ncbi:hypothetical protein LC087_00335 [Bacillus carboniphilus]|uniref:Surface antigen n=1 Tax=Bacillus carboniphilus TaxID=86663 RepID=A0ABY9JYN2_9BACI|nr:hypothetical protein [Bacillus carboniphilus]WLR42736.1 hypothetical protein LC087_00335 [Bacillus carboniphilus]